jgi:hypothetical protein
MKRLLLPTLFAALVFSACEKNDLNDDKIWDYKATTTASVKLVHAYTSLYPANVSATNGPAVDFYVNNVKVNATPLSYSNIYPNVTGSYAAVPSGLVNIKAVLNRASGGLPSDTLVSSDYRLAADGKYSIIMVDTLPNPTPASPILMVVGESIITPASYGKFKARFLNLYASSSDTLEIFSTYYNTVVCPAQVYKNLSDWIELTVPIPAPAVADVWQLRKKGTTVALNSVTLSPGISRSYTFWARGNPNVVGRTRNFGAFINQ